MHFEFAWENEVVEEAIVHIGMHKTGSSSVQISLQGYDDGETLYARFAEQTHSLSIHTAFSDQPEKFHHWVKLGYGSERAGQWQAHYRKILARDLQRRGRCRLIFSGEGIGLLDSKAKQRFIVELHRHVERVRIICYVRSHWLMPRHTSSNW